jgi:FkbM family methyltransferase
MKRIAKKLARKILPESIKSKFRAELLGYTTPRKKCEFERGEDEQGQFALIDRLYKFYTIPEIAADLKYAFKSNGDSVEEMHYFIEIAEQKKLLFDVGSASGIFSQIFCTLGNEKKAIAYEPSQKMNQVAKKLFDLNNCRDRVELNECAIGKEDGYIQLSQENNGFMQVVTTANSVATNQVCQVKIDSECDRLGIYPDIIKIDIEGYELEALLGAKETLSQYKPTIFLELHLNYLEERGVNPKTVIDYLQDHHYNFFSCIGESLAPRDIYDSLKSVYRFAAI